MGHIAYASIRFQDKTKAQIAAAQEIVCSYRIQGLRLTLRQIFYQFVVRNLIPNEERSYKRLSSVLTDARMAGLLDWDAIEDRGRQPVEPSEWSGIEDLVEGALSAYRLPRWEGQPNYVEQWVEKRALAGVLAPLAHEFHAVLMVNVGYSSASAMHEAAGRFKAAAERGQVPILLYLGDHDPSGEDMVRDVRQRLATFGADVDVRKLALTMEQVREHELPPNPAKLSDSRAASYMEKHGAQSWEVDALPPALLQKIVREAFTQLIDPAVLAEVRGRESRDKARLRDAVAGLLDDPGVA